MKPSFDIGRAILDSLNSRVPIVDRLVSYLFFCGMDVIEQSTADRYGHGVTIVGVSRGQGERGLPILATQALPMGLGNAYRSVDTYRIVDLFARLLAVSTVDCPKDIMLVAYRPDPFGISLFDVVEQWGLQEAWRLESAPVGLLPRLAEGEAHLIEVHMEGMGRRRASSRIRDIVSVAIRNTRSLEAIFQCLLTLEKEGKASVLDMEPLLGSDLSPPEVVLVDLAILTPHPELPEDFEVVERGRERIRIGYWGGVFDAVLATEEKLGLEVERALSKTVENPEVSVEVLSLFGDPDHCTALLVLKVPKDCNKEALVASLPTSPFARVHLSWCASRPYFGPMAPPFSATLKGPKVLAAGPKLDEVLEDPVEAGRKASEAYAKILSRLCKEA